MISFANSSSVAAASTSGSSRKLCASGVFPIPPNRSRSPVCALLVLGDPKQAIYRSRGADVETYLCTGVADALALAPGSTEAVIDWKSDVRASDETRAHHRQQVRTHRRLVGAPKGLVVYATSGKVEMA